MLIILAVKTTIVHPATEKHIEKYRIQPFYLVQETAELYKSVTLPYLETGSFNIQVSWNGIQRINGIYDLFIIMKLKNLFFYNFIVGIQYTGPQKRD